MRLAGITLYAIKKKRELALFKAEITEDTPLGTGMAEKEVIEKAETIFTSFKKFKNYYEPLGAEVKLLLEFRGKINEREASIVISEREIIYNNLPRDIVSELAYIIAEALESKE